MSDCNAKQQQHEKIDYVELPTKNMAASKAFFVQVFGWSFTDYGDEYSAFDHQGLNGGFFQSKKRATTETGSALIVFFSLDLEATLQKIEDAGGDIIQSIFDFPGGRRFHFTDPSGNEFAVWTEV